MTQTPLLACSKACDAPQSGSAHQPKEYTGPHYAPAETLYDVPAYATSEREEPDTSWLARFHD